MSHQELRKVLKMLLKNELSEACISFQKSSSMNHQ